MIPRANHNPNPIPIVNAIHLSWGNSGLVRHGLSQNPAPVPKVKNCRSQACGSPGEPHKSQVPDRHLNVDLDSVKWYSSPHKSQADICRMRSCHSLHTGPGCHVLRCNPTPHLNVLLRSPMAFPPVGAPQGLKHIPPRPVTQGFVIGANLGFVGAEGNWCCWGNWVSSSCLPRGFFADESFDIGASGILFNTNKQ